MARRPSLGTALVLAFCGAIEARQHTAMYHFPQWSPDGRWILASAVIDADSELYLISPAGGPPKQLTDNAASDDMARWIDGGRRILFVSDRRGRMETFTMSADGSDQQPTPHAERVTSTSPDGRAQLLEENGEIVAVEGAGKTRRTIASGRWAEQGAFSPDGQWIVYEQRSTDDPHSVLLSNIVVARADGSGASVVTAGTDPSWSPDGARLLSKVWDEKLRELFVTSARRDGTDIRRLARGVHPHWSPDGTQIAFLRDRGAAADVWVMAADGSGQRCLTCAP